MGLELEVIRIFALWILVVCFVSFLVTPFLAWRKGYAPYYWLFACGPVGLVVVCCLRSLKQAETPEQYEQMEARANLIGSILTGSRSSFQRPLSDYSCWGGHDHRSLHGRNGTIERGRSHLK